MKLIKKKNYTKIQLTYMKKKTIQSFDNFIPENL